MSRRNELESVNFNENIEDAHHSSRVFQDDSSCINDNKNIDITSFVHCFCPSRTAESGKVLVNYNVLLIVILTIGYGIAETLWTDTVLAVYLKDISNAGNKFVGLMETINGLSLLIFALPIGYFADKYSRSKAIRIGGAILLVASILDAILVAWAGCDLPPSKQLWKILFLISACLWGIGGGIVDGPTLALFADSTPAGSRSYYYVVLHRWERIASALGPLISIIFFAVRNDNWDLCVLRDIIFMGMGIEFSVGCLMFFLRDDKAIEVLSDMSSNDSSFDGNIDSPPSSVPLNPDLSLMNETTDYNLSHNGILLINNEETNDDVQSDPSKRLRLIPLFLFLYSLTAGFGLGLTKIFFPLYFRDILDLSPIQVQTIFTLEPLIIASSFGPARVLSNRVGRVQIIIISKVIGVFALILLSLSQVIFDKRGIVLIPFYLIHATFISATDPLEESMLMDFSPRKYRARWMSLDGVVEFGWAGSSIFGGIISDEYNYTTTILVSAIIQAFAILILVFFLLPIVPLDEDDLQSAVENKEHVHKSKTSQDVIFNLHENEEHNSLHVPLLSYPDVNGSSV